MHHSFFIKAVLFLCLCVNTVAHASSLTSRVDRNQIIKNETLVLTITFNDTISASKLDLSPIEKNFDIISSSPQTSNRVSVINGKTTRDATTSWIVTMAPKKKGSLLIPALSLNGQSSEAILITVNDMPATPSSPQPVKVTVTANKKQVYPGQQIILSVRLSAANSVNNMQGEPLVIEGADVQLLGQQESQEVDNGIARQIVEWRYAVFANQAGEITVPSQTFSGTIGARRRFFDSFGAHGQRVGARSDAISIPVNPKPTAFKHNWFPAERVMIQSKWSGDTTQLRVGEPITRSITIQAQGQRASAIPPIVEPTSTDYKRYADQAKLDNKLTAAGLIGIREESAAIIPSNSGELTFPEQTVHWWNTQSKQWQQATLAAETVTVLPSLTHATNTAQADLGTPPKSDSNHRNSSGSPGSIAKNEDNNNTRLWQISTLILGLLCFLQFILLNKSKQAPINEKQQQNAVQHDSEKQAWSKLQKAIAASNAVETRKLLVNWKRSFETSGHTSNLHSFAKTCSDEQLGQLLQTLDRHLYSKSLDLDWAQLSDSLKAYRTQQMSSKPKSNATSLEALYPS